MSASTRAHRRHHGFRWRARTTRAPDARRPRARPHTAAAWLSKRRRIGDFGQASRPHRSLPPLGPERLSGSSQARSVAWSLETQPQRAKAASRRGTTRTTLSPCGAAVRRADIPLRSARSDRRRAGVGCPVAARPRQREMSWQARGSGHTAVG